MTRFRTLRGGPVPVSLYRAINHQVGRAQNDYGLIQDKDRVAVALSGGKDSFTLMWVLHERLSRIPIKYELVGIHIDLGFPDGCAENIRVFCEKMGWELHVEHTDYGPLAHSPKNRENPCFLCSRLRKKHLFQTAHALGCNKIALGHHKDDLIETLFLNMCYAGEISSMSPLQEFFKGEVTVIRPLAYVDGSDIARFARLGSLPAYSSGCPSDKTSKRVEIRALLNELYQGNKKIKGNLFRSMNRVRPDYLLKHMDK